MLRQAKNFLLAFLLAMVPALGHAQVLAGVVHNKTTGTPAIADEVMLIDVSAGMKEIARARTDAQGRFQFRVHSKNDVPRLVRVVHAGVSYQSAVNSTGQPLDISVFDSTQKTTGVKAALQVMRLEADSQSMRITQMFSLVNVSDPPRTVDKEQVLSIALPQNATLVSSVAEGPDGVEVKSVAAVVPGENRCYFNFPLRPGTTKIQFQVQAPYSGSLRLTPQLPFPTEMFGVMVPPSMQFAASEPGSYASEPDPAGGMVAVVKNVPAGNAPGFAVSGSGPGTGRENANAASARMDWPQQASAQAPAAQLAPAPAATDSRTRWLWILGIMTVALSVFGGSYLIQRRSRPQGASPQPAAAAAAGSVRDQLFQLEVDRIKKNLTPAQYAKAKSALEKKLQASIRKKQ